MANRRGNSRRRELSIEESMALTGPLRAEADKLRRELLDCLERELKRGYEDAEREAFVKERIEKLKEYFEALAQLDLA